MNTEILQSFGLSKVQARAYIFLVKNGASNAKQISDKIGETRTNTYMVLERLIELQLIHKNKNSKVIRYVPNSPVQLQNIVEHKRTEILNQEKVVKDAMPNLLSYYYTFQNRPGIRFFEGREGIMKMYEDHLRVRKDVYFISGDGDHDLLGEDLYKIIEMEGKLKIPVHGIEVYSPKRYSYGKANDKRLGRNMTWIPKGAYNSPVNVYTYGDKTALISYEEELMGTIIESPKIAEGMRQIFAMVKLSSEQLWKKEGRKQPK